MSRHSVNALVSISVLPFWDLMLTWMAQELVYFLGTICPSFSNLAAYTEREPSISLAGSVMDQPSDNMISLKAHSTERVSNTREQLWALRPLEKQHSLFQRALFRKFLHKNKDKMENKQK